jgi:integrase
MEAQAASIDGFSLPPDRITIAMFAAQWLETVRPTIRWNTWRGYETLLRVHAIPAIGNIKLARLNAAKLQWFYSERLDSGLSPTTVGNVHRVLKKMLNDAVRWGNLNRNPVTLVSPPPNRNREMAIFSPPQVRSFLEVARQDDLHAFYVTAIFTAARLSELLGLKWQDCDIDGKEPNVHIRHAYRPVEDGYALTPPKSKRSVRRISLSPVAVSALKAHRSQQAQQALSLGPKWDDAWGLVFASSRGTPLDGINILKRSFRPLLNKAGLPPLRLHDLRHTGISLALSEGTPVVDVSRMAGHAQVSTTLNIYGHVIPGGQQRATAAIEAAIFG